MSSTATGFMEWYNSWLDKLTRHFVVRFPFGSSSTLSKDGDVFNILQDMNIIFCEVLSHFMAFKMAAAAALAEATPTGSDSLSKMSKSPAWFKSIHHYILKLYNPSISLESSEDMAIDGSSHLFRRSLQKPNHLRSSFPVIWSLLNTVSDEDRRELFETIIGYHLKSPNPSSQGSGLLFDFLAKICTVSGKRYIICEANNLSYTPITTRISRISRHKSSSQSAQDLHPHPPKHCRLALKMTSR